MDIRKFEVEESATIHLKDSADAPMVDDHGQPVTWTVYGPGSKQYAAAQSARNNLLVEALRKKGKFEQTPAEKTAEQTEFLVACTKECSGNIEMDDGKGGKLTGAALHRAILSNPKLGFIADQVGKHVAEWSNFTPPSPKN